MPRPEVLRVLGMTPEQWGRLPYDRTTGAEGQERVDLRRKAGELLKQERESAAKSSLDGRISRIEESLSKVDGAGLQSLEARVSRIESELRNMDQVRATMNSRIESLERIENERRQRPQS